MQPLLVFLAHAVHPAVSAPPGRRPAHPDMPLVERFCRRAAPRPMAIRRTVGPQDPRTEARRTEAVLEPSAAGVVPEADGQQDAVSYAVAHDKPVGTSVVLPRQWPTWRRSRSSSPITSARPYASATCS